MPEYSEIHPFIFSMLALSDGWTAGIERTLLQGCQIDPNQLKLAEAGWSFP